MSLPFSMTNFRGVDGDSVGVEGAAVIPLELDSDFTDEHLRWTKGELPGRLITVDTPERRTDLQGWIAASIDTNTWLQEHHWSAGLEFEIVGKDNLGRYLIDIFVTGDRNNTLSRHLLVDKGWPPYVKGK